MSDQNGGALHYIISEEQEMGREGAEAAAAAVEELREIAKFYYNSATPQVQEQAKHFFNSMDLDGNGEINLVEFLSFMREEGYFKQMRSNSIFEMLDPTGRGTLAFMDVVTLYYIIKSGRPLCDSCRNHDGSAARFLDNFTLLQAAKPTTSKQAAHTEPTANTQQPLLLGKGDSASISKSTPTLTSKGGDTKSKALIVTPAKSIVATTATSSKHIKSSLDQNAIVPAPKPTAQTKPTGRSRHQQPLLQGKGGSASTSTSTSKNDVITSYMMSELDRIVLDQTRPPPPPPSRFPSRSPSRPLNHSPSVNVARSESTTSTPKTILQSHQEQYAIVPATRQVPWMKVASVALKALEAMTVIANVASITCTIM
ncbi:hypothetical protein AAHA92_04356 [Salvia divinorum]|uniref:EF-hand domain-containing protein n=1 Tax=Salvia divinorum TaxID=28513 RepID=A0ABD1HYY0_SALDI